MSVVSIDAEFSKPRLAFFRNRRPLVMAASGMLLAAAFWHAVVVLFEVPVYLVPTPVEVAKTIVADGGLLLSNALPTFAEAMLGFLIGNFIAVAIAIAFVYNRVIEELFYPVAVIIKTIPIVAIAPVLKIMLGNGMEPKIVIAALISFFPTLVNTVRGLQAVNPQLLELMHVLSATKYEIFRRVRIQSALPYVFAALKITITTSVLGAIVAEWIGANQGLGYLLLQSMFDFNTPRLYATIVMASFIAVAGFSLVGIVERRVVRWDPGLAM